MELRRQSETVTRLRLRQFQPQQPRATYIQIQKSVSNIRRAKHFIFHQNHQAERKLIKETQNKTKPDCIQL